MSNVVEFPIKLGKVKKTKHHMNTVARALGLSESTDVETVCENIQGLLRENESLRATLREKDAYIAATETLFHNKYSLNLDYQDTYGEALSLASIYGRAAVYSEISDCIESRIVDIDYKEVEDFVNENFMAVRPWVFLGDIKDKKIKENQFRKLKASSFESYKTVPSDRELLLESASNAVLALLKYDESCKKGD